MGGDAGQFVALFMGKWNIVIHRWMEWGDSPWVAYFQTKPQGWMMGKWGNLGKTMGKTHHLFPVDFPPFHFPVTFR